MWDESNEQIKEETSEKVFRMVERLIRAFYSRIFSAFASSTQIHFLLSVDCIVGQEIVDIFLELFETKVWVLSGFFIQVNVFTIESELTNRCC